MRPARTPIVTTATATATRILAMALAKKITEMPGIHTNTGTRSGGEIPQPGHVSFKIGSNSQNIRRSCGVTQ